MNRIFYLLLAASVSATSALGAVAEPPDFLDGRPAIAEPTIAACQAKTLDLQEELVKTQDALAQWQARAIRAEAQIALQAIAQQREKAKGAAPAPTEGPPK